MKIHRGTTSSKRSICQYTIRRKIFQWKNMHMLNAYGKTSRYRTLGNTMICTFCLMFYLLLTYSKISEKYISITMVWMRLISIRHQDSAWQAALKMAGVRLELLTDIDMHLFIEKGLREGISMITHRHAKANNCYVPDYDPSQPSNHMTNLDANNLYGWAMYQALPVHGFRWLEKEEFEHVSINSV